MASRIKGITVEIGGDVTGLEKALSTVNKTIKNTQSQLKDVERLLKLDPTNTELLAQKQRLLQDAVGATKDKLVALKDAQEQAKKQLESGSLGQEQYDALQREIIDTENELDNLAKKAGEANAAMKKIDEAGKTIENIGNKISSVGEDLTKYVTTPIAGIGAAAMASFSEVDSAVDGMISKTGAAGEELEKLQKTVENIATTIPTDFTTAANAVGEVSTRFDDVGDQLEDLSTKFVQFSTLNNVDVVTAIDNVQASMAAFGVPTQEATAVLDTLNAIAQQTGTDVNTLTSMLTANAGAMKEMGMDYDDAAFFMAELNKNGVDVSSTMTGLKTAWKTASAEGKSMKDALSEMNSTIKNAKTDQEAYQAAIELFGSKAGPALAQAVRDGRLSLEDLNVTMDQFAGSVENTFDSTLDPVDQVTLAMNELKLIGADLASVAQEMLMPALEMLRDKIHQLREWWGNLGEEQQQNIIKFAWIVAAIGPALIALGKLTSGVGKGVQTFAKFGTEISTLIAQTQAGTGPLVALKTAIAGISGPVLAVVAVVGVLVAAFVNLWKNNEEFRNKITATWDEIKSKVEEFGAGIKARFEEVGITFEGVTETLKKVWNGFCELLAPVFTGAFDIISKALSTALGVLTGLLDIFIGVFTGNWNKAWQGIKGVASSVWDGIKGVISTALGTIKGVVNTFLGWFGTDWDTVWSKARTKVSNIWNAIVEKAGNFVQSIKDKWNDLRQKTSEIFTTIGQNISNKWSAIKTTIFDKVNDIRSSISEKWSAIKTTISDKMQSIKENIVDKWSSIRESVSTKVQSIKDSITNKWDTIKDNVTDKVQSIKDNVTDKFDAMREAVTDKFESIKEGIRDKLESAKETVRDIIDKIKGFFNFNIELPHIPMPHFSVQPEGWKLSDLLQGVIPKLDIAWYRKAMNNGMILNSPTIFGMKDGQLLGAGEAGSETVVGTSSLMQMIRTAVEATAKSAHGDLNVYVNSYGTDAAAIAEEIGAEINRKRRMAGSW